MSKWKWLLVILVVVFIGYLIISKVFPDIGIGIDNVVGPAAAGFFTGIKQGIEASPIWQQYDIYFSMIFGGAVVGLLMWQGHNAFNKVRGTMVHSAAKEAGWQTTPPVAPPTPATAPKTEPAPAPVQPAKPKEETAAT